MIRGRIVLETKGEKSLVTFVLHFIRMEVLLHLQMHTDRRFEASHSKFTHFEPLKMSDISSFIILTNSSQGLKPSEYTLSARAKCEKMT